MLLTQTNQPKPLIFMNQQTSAKAIDQVLPGFSKYGYPVEIFCTKQIIESMTCVICLGVYRDPVTSNTCGHTFCKQCFADLKAKGGSSTTCPDCRKVVSSAIDTFAIKSSILNQQVKCPLKVMKNLSCNWEGKLDLLDTHLEHECKEVPRKKLKGYPQSIFMNLATRDTLTCNLCKGIFREPVIVECGHTFCKNCIDKYEEYISANTEAGHKLCPDCFKRYASYFHVIQMQKMILREQVACTADVLGKQCAWKGTVEDWEIHRQNCNGVLKEWKDTKGGKGKKLPPLRAAAQRSNNASENASQPIIQAGPIIQVQPIIQDQPVIYPQPMIQLQPQPQQQQQGQPQGNQERLVSRHRFLDSCEGCCSGIEKVLKFVLFFFLKSIIALLLFLLYLSTLGYVLPIRDPALAISIVLMANSVSSGWLLFFGIVTPTVLFVFIDLYNLTTAMFNSPNGNTNETRGMDWLSMKYLCYLGTICNDTTFRNATQQEKEKMTNLWHHLYWWIMKSGIYITTLIWTAVVDESEFVKNYGTWNLVCRIGIGVNLGMDVVDYFLTFRRIRALHRQYNL